jgi:tripartite-type tricarboxylate transporter receptor subunit TctC
MIHRRRLMWRSGAVALVASLTLAACDEIGLGGGGQDGEAGDCNGYPSQDLELIVPYSAGGGYDLWGRMLGEALSNTLPNDVDVVVRNVEGGAGLIGANQVLAAEADGNTLLISDPGNLTSGYLQGGLEVDPREITVIGRVTSDPQIVLVSPDSGIESWEDLVALSEERPIKQADSDVSPIVIGLYETAGMPYEFVLHEGGSEARLSVIRGDTDSAIFSHLSAVEQMAAGDLNGILYIAEEKPNEGEPGYAEVADMETIQDAGYPELAAPLEQHRMLFAAPAVPDCVRETLEAAMAEGMEGEAFQESAAENELAPRFLGSEESKEIVVQTFDTFSQYEEAIEEAQQ